ncbi:helix-turn-helix domain-containing protein [Streptomyces sp. NPDC057386]|uniref:helix-turn-helix domain-containing protein n=1 Tax=unclassified Streptomyces TaxID=2593676 RepID=UPI00362E77F9
MKRKVTGGVEDGFAALLRELKDRSGLSYGALAKRLHMSTSTLHRYCNGAAVPNEYAPVERLARVCRATPEELVELHRRWVLADASRGRAAAGTPDPDPATEPAPGSPEPSRSGPAPQPAEDPDRSPSPVAPTASDEAPPPTEALSFDDAPPARTAPSASPWRRRRTAWIAAASVVAVLGAVTLALQPFSDRGTDDKGGRRPAGATAGAAPGDTAGAATARPSTSTPSASASPSASESGASGAPSAPVSARASSTASSASGGLPLAVGVRPYVYDTPCSQHFLVDSEPEQVGPPAGEQDAPRWSDAYGAVSSTEQEIAVTVQGTGPETVVLEALHVRIVSKGKPLAWNDYSMGVGCGGDVETASFTVDLDEGSPTVAVGGARHGFPYKVSESDPEVFYVTARTVAHDVRWELTLDWSSGSRRGTVRIDDDGKPFRTSAGEGRPGYDYPLGGNEWIERTG